jgi:hypothetical protein
MAQAGFKPITLLPDADKQKQNEFDSEYWMRMKASLKLMSLFTYDFQELAVFQEPGIISSVAFVPKSPYHLAATNSNRVSF